LSVVQRTLPSDDQPSQTYSIGALEHSARELDLDQNLLIDVFRIKYLEGNPILNKKTNFHIHVIQLLGKGLVLTDLLCNFSLEKLKESDTF
jgi:hypothetical protein